LGRKQKEKKKRGYKHSGFRRKARGDSREKGPNLRKSAIKANSASRGIQHGLGLSHMRKQKTRGKLKVGNRMKKASSQAGQEGKKKKLSVSRLGVDWR